MKKITTIILTLLFLITISSVSFTANAESNSTAQEATTESETSTTKEPAATTQNPTSTNKANSKNTLSADDVYMTFFFYRSSTYRIKNVSDAFHVEANYSKKTAKKLTGVQYVYAKDKAFKKIYKKGTMKLSAPKTIKTCEKDSGTSGKIGATIPTISYGKCWVKWRVYKTVKGKKTYSDWKQVHMYMNGLEIE